MDEALHASIFVHGMPWNETAAESGEAKQCAHPSARLGKIVALPSGERQPPPSSKTQPAACTPRWLRSYINGAADQFCEARLPDHLAGLAFCDVVSWLFDAASLVLIGREGKE